MLSESCLATAALHIWTWPTGRRPSCPLIQGFSQRWLKTSVAREPVRKAHSNSDRPNQKWVGPRNLVSLPGDRRVQIWGAILGTTALPHLSSSTWPPLHPPCLHPRPSPSAQHSHSWESSCAGHASPGHHPSCHRRVPAAFSQLTHGPFRIPCGPALGRAWARPDGLRPSDQL